ncbi:Tetratricopeptide repeat protein [Anatilimnocola aggregata]|uniref:Tetratricopeptide repeat protein n=1 Tax=Anatilimnocola aggregata TaxID=2528021 RepID=A0A517Y707_9BACT|nr:tetratricopeptide repeat protein [Anatilimnocola aggregata]QDU25922.1 Tetratricopeptide repeat protein [Anatilimnocola aggregata]
MTPHLSRALVLIEQNRYAQALGELQLHLGQNADDAVAHALMSQCHLNLEHYDEAQQQAAHAIHLAPDESIGYRMLAAVLLQRRRYPEAEKAADAALQIEPHDADLFGLKASIFTQLERWREAVQAADAGLAIDPENLVCLNVRAQALTMLGDRAGAAQTVQDALRHNPDDPWIHANQGWASLHANEPLKAAEHFRETLRLDPDMELARAGIIEALKARNFVYRGMLQYFLWMARLPSQARWGIVIGIFLAQRFLGQFARNNPDFAPFVWPILAVLISFAVMSWLAYPLFNLMLRLDRFGRHALSVDQRKGANLLGTTLLIAIVSLVAFFVTGHPVPLLSALVFGLLSLPVSAIYLIEAGWPRNTMFACTGGLLLLGLAMMIPDSLVVGLNNKPLSDLVSSVQGLFPLGIIASQFLANYLATVEVKK